MTYSVFIEVLRAIVMAQASSNYAKIRKSAWQRQQKYRLVNPKRVRSAKRMTYKLKIVEIVRALRMIDTNAPMGIYYYVKPATDLTYPAILVIFDIELEDRYQISFHLPMTGRGVDNTAILPWVGKGRSTHISRKYGSRDCARILIDRFAL